MLRDQAFEPRLHRVRQRVVGGAHVDELGVAARRRMTRACSIDQAADFCRNELSVCQSWLPSR